MVIQRDKPAPIWGVAKPDTKVTVRVTGFAKLPAKAVTNIEVQADAKGKWKAVLGPFPAGGPCEITVSGLKEGRDTNVTYTLTDVLVGDVWICSGQSNMKMALHESRNAEAAMARANPKVRLMNVPEVASVEPQTEVDSGWMVCTPENAKGFSATAYFFGLSLQTNINVPIGLISSSWGGTRIQAWMSLDSLRSIPEAGGDVGAMDELIRKIRAGKTVEQLIEAWWQANDAGSAGGKAPWAAPDLDVSQWQTVPDMPKQWSAMPFGGYRGVAWFRKEVTIPDDWAGKDLQLSLARIVDVDTTFFNGVAVGGDESVWRDRVYSIPGKLVKPGKATLAVRIYGHSGEHGFRPDLSSNFKLEVAGTANSIPLAGDWQCRTNSKPLTGDIPRKPNANTVSADFNGMIAPLLALPFKGVIWYQGEWNASEGRLYNTLLPTMIQDWRKRAGLGDFPFLVAQLASLDPAQPADAPEQSGWADVREAQWRTAERTPNSGLATCIDTHGLHPVEKDLIGERLACVALARVYGKKIAYRGPTFASMKKTTDGIEVTFTNVVGELIAKADLKAFSLAGVDRRFVWATARVSGKNTVIVTAPSVKEPTIVRYGWADSPECTLFDKADLPALPFRSDMPTDP